MTVRYVSLSTPGGPVLAWSNEAWAQVAAHYAGVKLAYSKRSLVRRSAVPVVPVGSPVARSSRVGAASGARRTGVSQDGAS